jgi:plasmid stabilization system protein ParE
MHSPTSKKLWDGTKRNNRVWEPIFALTVLAAIDSLPENPLIYQKRERRKAVRWFLPPRFPHRIVYRIDGSLITVFAVLHAARHDREWRRRL